MKNEIDALSLQITELCGTFNFERKVVLEALLTSYESIGNTQVNRLNLPSVLPDYEHEGLRVELNRRVVSLDGRYITLTGKEWALLDALVKSDGRPTTKVEMADLVYDGDNRDSNTLEVFMSHLRGKIGKQAIRTMRGVGYVLAGKTVLKN